jgi:transcriptional regulator with XRE-family HTH domain
MKTDSIQPNEKNLDEIATRIRKARREAHLSQLELGNGIGVSDKSISAYEQGRSVPPFEKLKRIAEATSHPLAYFTEDNVHETTIAVKLQSIERELQEVKSLLKKAK